MQKEYKLLKFKDSGWGRKQMELELKRLSKFGWVISPNNGISKRKGNFGVVKTVGLGMIFLPLALLGRKKDDIMLTLEREAGGNYAPSFADTALGKWLNKASMAQDRRRR